MKANNWNPATSENIGASYAFRQVMAMPGQKPFPKVGDEGFNSHRTIGVQGGLVERRVAEGTMRDYRNTPIAGVKCAASYAYGQMSRDYEQARKRVTTDGICAHSFWLGYLTPVSA